MEADTLQFIPVHTSFDEQATQLDTRQRHFIMVDSTHVDDTHRCILVAIHTPVYTWVGARTWSLHTTRWELFDLVGRGKQWQVYHNCQHLARQKIQVNSGDYFALYEQASEGGNDIAPGPSPAPAPPVSPFGTPSVPLTQEEVRSCSGGTNEDRPDKDPSRLDAFQ